MNQFQYDHRDKIDIERAKFILVSFKFYSYLIIIRWMLRTPIDKLKIINRNEELEHLYNTQKNIFKNPSKIEEFSIFLLFLN